MSDVLDRAALAEMVAMQRHWRAATTALRKRAAAR